MGKFVNKKIGNITGKTGGYVEKTIVNDSFVADLRRIKPLTQAQEKELFKQIEESKMRVQAAEGTSNYYTVKTSEEKVQLSLRNEIISRNQYLNYAIAKRYNNTDIVMDLVNVGAIGMIEAFESYDYNKNVRFCTYATYYIRRAINAYITKENIAIRTTNDAKLISKVKKIENRFFAKEGRYPTVDEIKSILAAKYDIVDVDSMDLSMADIVSIDVSLTSDDEYTIKDNSQEFNTRTASYNGYVETENVDDSRNIINMYLSKLSSRERIILSMSTGYGYERDYKDYEIAEELDLTSERVRQIRLAASKKLQAMAARAF